MPDEITAAKQRNLHWEAETLRLTALFPTAEVASAPKHWAQVIGEEPELSSEHKGGETRVEGPYAECKLSLVVRQDRIDWIISPQLGTDPGEWAKATTGKRVHNAMELVEGIARKWAGWDGCPRCQRVAVGAVLLAEVESREAGYEALAEYLPGVKLAARNTRDFLYQINRPTEANSLQPVPLVNRLCKWSVASFVTMPLTLVVGGMRRLPENAAFACRLELDVNTDADFQGEIGREQLPALVCELCSYVEKSAREGDQE